ncbi:hypothetical protein [Micrococcus sp. TA1]|uniref:hypothetical protein n=1 Tax=Micrococcus sp. TA1 TaxID=681627 RepID=UPI00160987E4|nr:hypothetical protein [Micrococcus sp. TA1]MBB5748526.1 hypothetical protein [Micrococcus sp. TA1]
MAIEVPKIDPTTKAILEPKTNAAISKKVADDITAGNTPVATALNAASSQSFVDLLKTAYGSVVAPQPLTLAGLQQAAEEAKAQGKVLVASGTLTTTGTLLLRCSHDLSTLTITYTGTGTAVQIGDPALDVRAIVGTAPRVKNGNKGASGTGWTDTTCGIELVNLVGSNITIPHAYGFFDGLRLTGNGTGVVYNNVYIGRLENNKRNIHNTIGPAGSWNGENTFYGGQLSHLNSEPGAGVVQLLFTGSAESEDFGRATGLRFIGQSIETTIAERLVDMQAGKSILFIGTRFEDPRGAARAPVHWGPKAADNMFIAGYNAERMRQTSEPGAIGNAVLTPGLWQMPGRDQTGTGRGGGAILNNATSSSAGALSVMEAAWAGEDSATAYRAQVSANYSRYKRAADTFPRIEIDHSNARIYFGDGAAASTAYLSRAASFIAVNGASLAFLADNTYDIGPGVYRPRDVNAARDLSAGTSVRYGNGGALPTPIASLRGQTRLVHGAAGVADTLHICIKDAADAYVWKQIA